MFDIEWLVTYEVSATDERKKSVHAYVVDVIEAKSYTHLMEKKVKPAVLAYLETIYTEISGQLMVEVDILDARELNPTLKKGVKNSR